MRFFFLFLLALVLSCQAPKTPPNILFVITDDQSWLHLGAYGDEAVRTPNINALAENRVKFNNAYCAAPSCSPSRATILTGQDMYRLEEGGVLTGFIRDKFIVFPSLLEANGFTVGGTGKKYWPKTRNVPNTHDTPAGKTYSTKRLKEVPPGISKTDYAANFQDFLEQRDPTKPFFFWTGIGEPHIPHPKGNGIKNGIDTSKITLPEFYPDAPIIRSTLADYLFEIEWADKVMGQLMNILEQHGEANNTLIVFTSDNGMPFPRAKATLYDYGVRMPLIVSWKNKINSNRTVDDPVSLIDLAPTFLETATIDIPRQMTGRSLTNLLFSKKSGKLDAQRDFVVSAIEKHTHARPDSLGFPRRALHTEDWTYIVNYEPNRWPAGDSGTFIPNWDFYGDIDPTDIKKYFVGNQNEETIQTLFELNFGKVPFEELYHKPSDPDMITNLAENANHQSKKKELKQKLNDYLRKTKDPRIEGKAPWDAYYLDN